MKKYSGIMCVLDSSCGQNGLQYGIKQNCRRYSLDFLAHNESEARCLCEQVGLIYDGQILAEYDE